MLLGLSMDKARRIARTTSVALALARFPLERNRSSDKKSRKINKSERILVAKDCQLLRNSL